MMTNGEKSKTKRKKLKYIKVNKDTNV